MPKPAVRDVPLFSVGVMRLWSFRAKGSEPRYGGCHEVLATPEVATAACRCAWSDEFCLLFAS